MWNCLHNLVLYLTGTCFFLWSSLSPWAKAQLSPKRQIPVSSQFRHIYRAKYEKGRISYLSFILDNERLSNLVLSLKGICGGLFEGSCYGWEWVEAGWMEIGYLRRQHLHFWCWDEDRWVCVETGFGDIGWPQLRVQIAMNTLLLIRCETVSLRWTNQILTEYDNTLFSFFQINIVRIIGQGLRVT